MTFQVGGATIDTQANNITLANAIGNGGTGGLTKQGAGTLTFSAKNTYSGATIVNGGTLEIAGGIAASGTSLIDVQSGMAVLETVNVNKPDLNINTSSLGVFEVTGGTHVLGSITGSGTTIVDGGASLTAASISQGALILSDAKEFMDQSNAGWPTADAITPVPEPSSFVLLAGAFVLLAIFYRLKPPA